MSIGLALLILGLTAGALVVGYYVGFIVGNVGSPHDGEVVDGGETADETDI